MKKVEKRRFSLRDAILFVAATAFGLGGWVSYVDKMREADHTAGRLPDGGYEWFLLLSIVSLSWSFAVVLSQWISVRRTCTRLSRQPGYVACLAAVVIPLVILANETLGLFLYCGGNPNPLECWNSYHFELQRFIQPPLISPAVCLVWIILLFERRWKFRAEPIEWIGILLGFYWLIAAPLLHFYWNMNE